MAGQMGAQSRLLFDTATPFDVSSIWFEFLSESIVQEAPIVNTAGVRGTRTHASERNRQGVERVSGSLNCEVSRILFDNMLPCALGTAEAANVFNVAETLTEFYLLIDKGADIALVSEAVVNRMTISGSQAQPVNVNFEIEAESVTWGQSWPGTPPSRETSKPYMFSDLGDVTIESSGREVLSFSITVDNAVQTDVWANNLTRDETLLPGDRIVSVEITVPATAANSGLTAHSVAGAAVSLVLTNADEASSVLTIDLGRVSFNPATPVVNGKGQIELALRGQARGLGDAGATAPDIKITNAHA